MLRKLHSTPGLIAGLLLLVVALTGAVLSIFPALDQAAAKDAGGIDVATLAGRVTARVPGVETLVREPSGTIVAYHLVGDEQRASIIDPASGEAVAAYQPSALQRWVRNLHRKLLLDDAGRDGHGRGGRLHAAHRALRPHAARAAHGRMEAVVRSGARQHASAAAQRDIADCARRAGAVLRHRTADVAGDLRLHPRRRWRQFLLRRAAERRDDRAAGSHAGAAGGRCVAAAAVEAGDVQAIPAMSSNWRLPTAPVRSTLPPAPGWPTPPWTAGSACTPRCACCTPAMGSGGSGCCWVCRHWRCLFWP